MNFNVYINKEVGEKVSKMAKNLKKSRNSIINEALEEWLDKRIPSKWPRGFFDFEPIPDIPNFKDTRKELKSHIERDPLE